MYGVFQSPTLKKSSTINLNYSESTRALSPQNPTFGKTTLFDDGKLKYSSIRSIYKNESKINLGSINSEIEPF
jgi:hypothetical protein